MHNLEAKRRGHLLNCAIRMLETLIVIPAKAGMTGFCGANRSDEV